MISSNSHKFLFLVFFAFLLTASCSFFQNNTTKTKNDITNSEVQTNIPFSIKEPETFQAEIIISTFIDDVKTERITFTAQDGEKLLQTFNFGGKNSNSVLNLENNTYLINHSAKNYRKVSSEKSSAFSNDTLIKSLTSKWLNQKASSTFEKLEDKDGLKRFRVNFQDSKESEILIFVDEKLGIPVKQEFYKLNASEKTLTYSIEIKNFKTEIEKDLFNLPTDYQEITQ